MRAILVGSWLAGLALLSFAGVSVAADGKHEWVELGSQKVDAQKEKDTITVGSDEGQFGRIRIEVRDGDLVMSNIKVVFGNGESFSPDVKHEFKEGSRSRVIDLPGGKRVIKKVEFTYRSEKASNPATVVLFGRQKDKD
jgi:hypothetical protein